MSEQFLFIGTYTHDEGGEGIYTYKFNTETGELTYQCVMKGIKEPSFLCLDPSGEHLYAASEIDDYEGETAGAVYAYKINRDSGELTLLNERSTVGTITCHLSVDSEDKCLVVANYGSGSVIVYPLNMDGSLGEASDFIQFEGSSINTARQEGPHAHSAIISADDKYVFVPDLGCDKIMQYKLDSDNAKLIPNNPPFIKMPPGSGPRHFIIDKSMKYAYVINELAGTIVTFDYHAGSGTLRAKDSVNTLPEGFDGIIGCADLHLTASEKFLYGTNRGHNSLVICKVNDDGTLESLGHEPSGGDEPRNFTISGDDQFLLMANQKEDNILTFKIDHQTGQLEKVQQLNDIGKPVCLIWLH
ncbi:MAG: lactonase family protein [Lentisphaeria bacterium]|nr:lactonase family protein [Lentisphaeria bacterium]